MKKVVLAVLAVLVFLSWAAPAWAEPLNVDYTEPVEAGTLAYTTVYWCRGATCTNWTMASQQPSDDGNGGDSKSIQIPIPLTAGTLPVTIRVRVTATNTSQNESLAIIDTFTFSP